MPVGSESLKAICVAATLPWLLTVRRYFTKAPGKTEADWPGASDLFRARSKTGAGETFTGSLSRSSSPLLKPLPGVESLSVAGLPWPSLGVLDLGVVGQRAAREAGADQYRDVDEGRRAGSQWARDRRVQRGDVAHRRPGRVLQGHARGKRIAQGDLRGRHAALVAHRQAVLHQSTGEDRGRLARGQRLVQGQVEDRGGRDVHRLAVAVVLARC